jgi:hypothetical protein
MNGNITKEGIRLDLEWMSRVGIGGFQTFDAALGTPQVVSQRLVYMTPPWQDALRYATDLAGQQGLEMAIATSPGWSETGGPWVKPDQAMKKLVWTEVSIQGGRRFQDKLPQPSAVAGPFQDVRRGGVLGGPPPALPEFYRDVAVLAFRTPGAPVPQPEITLGGKPVDSTLLSDGSLAKGVPVDVGVPGPESCITYSYPQPTRVASLMVGVPIGTDFFLSPLAQPLFEASDDGTHFRKVIDVPAGNIVEHTVTFAPVTASYFRLCLLPPPPPFTDLLGAVAPGADTHIPGLTPKQPTRVEVVELRLLATPRVNRFEEKAGFALVPDYYAIPTISVAPNESIVPGEVLDLTSRMQPDGSLDWSPPPGTWTVLRFGYSLTGSENHPATTEATGLEVDKLDAQSVRNYLDTYLATYEQALGPQRIGAHGLRALVSDSTEVGPQNWTPSLPAEFLRRRGYDMKPWMPTLAGVIVGSAERSDRFLYDFRQTLAELMSDAHYAQVAAGAKSRGLIQYGEATESGRPVLGDDMEMRRHTDVPMSAMWTYSEKKGVPSPSAYADVRGAASVAHIYGQNLVAAESLTSAFAPWYYAPRELRPMIDMEFLLGVNRPVIHTSVHQPLIDQPPGLRLAIFGQDFNRNETWAEQAGPWVTYLSRTSYLLQQGHFAADVLYFYGEEAPLTALYGSQVTPDTPRGYGFDFANPDVLLNRVKVQDGFLVTDSGMRYRVLYLGGSSSRMTLRVLRRIQALVEAGATVVGTRPLESPSLADDPETFQKVADSVWSDSNQSKGLVIVGSDINAALTRLGLPPDFQHSRPEPDTDIQYLHRILGDGDLYFVCNRKSRDERVEATFRVTGREPRIWHADTGQTEPVSYDIEGGRTMIPLHFDGYESYFVVFRVPSATSERRVTEPTYEPLTHLDSGWKLTFQAGRGAPAQPRSASVGSWSDDPEPGVRYFSGTATYTRTLTIPQAWKRGAARLMLDLGDVRELAEVSVNGKSVGVLWHPPYRIDLTNTLRRGNNRLELRVTNLWVNRLIGDKQPGAHAVAHPVALTYLPNAPLRPSGLLGPVVLETTQGVAERSRPTGERAQANWR